MNNDQFKQQFSPETPFDPYLLKAKSPGKPGGQKGFAPIEYIGTPGMPNDYHEYLDWLTSHGIPLDSCSRYVFRINGELAYGLVTSGFFKPGTTELDPKIKKSLRTKQLDNPIFEALRQSVLNGDRA